MQIQKFWLVCLSVMFMLAGCQEATNPTAPISPDSKATQDASTKPADDTTDSDIVTQPYKSYVIAAIGDSITEGVGASSGTGGYPAMLETKLRNAAYDVVVRNKGIPGADSGTANMYFRNHISGADVALIMIGTNDISNSRGCEDPNNCNTLGHIRAMVQTALNLGVVPVLATITPKNPNSSYAFYNTQIESLNQEITALGAEYQIKVVDTYNAIWAGGGSALFSDHHHFNDQGYDVLAQAFYDTLTTLIFGPQSLPLQPTPQATPTPTPQPTPQPTATP